MLVSRAFRWSIAFVAALACASDEIPGPPKGLNYAAATGACGPADGPAVGIYLSPQPVQSIEPPAPYLRIYIAQSLDQLAGKSWLLAGQDADGAAWHHSSNNEFEIANSGVLTVTSVSPDNTIEGKVQVTFPSAGLIRGGFRAVWIQRNYLCG